MSGEEHIDQRPEETPEETPQSAHAPRPRLDRRQDELPARIAIRPLAAAFDAYLRQDHARLVIGACDLAFYCG